jgi:hypothetical protein
MEKIEPNKIAESVVRRPWIDPVVRELSISEETANGFALNTFESATYSS